MLINKRNRIFDGMLGLLWMLLNTFFYASPAIGQTSTPTAQPAGKNFAAYSATFWKTRTIVLPSGTQATITQRIREQQDSSGAKTKDIYKPTQGPNHDGSAALQRSLRFTAAASSGTPLELTALSRIASAGTRPASGSEAPSSNTEVIELGSATIVGVEAHGKRYVKKNADGSTQSTQDRWYAPALNTVVKLADIRPDGNSTILEMTELSR